MLALYITLSAFVFLFLIAVLFHRTGRVSRTVSTIADICTIGSFVLTIIIGILQLGNSPEKPAPTNTGNIESVSKYNIWSNTFSDSDFSNSTSSDSNVVKQQNIYSLPESTEDSDNNSENLSSVISSKIEHELLESSVSQKPYKEPSSSSKNPQIQSSSKTSSDPVSNASSSNSSASQDIDKPDNWPKNQVKANPNVLNQQQLNGFIIKTKDREYASKLIYDYNETCTVSSMLFGPEIPSLNDVNLYFPQLNSSDIALLSVVMYSNNDRHEMYGIVPYEYEKNFSPPASFKITSGIFEISVAIGTPGVHLTYFKGSINFYGSGDYYVKLQPEV